MRKAARKMFQFSRSFVRNFLEFLIAQYDTRTNMDISFKFFFLPLKNQIKYMGLYFFSGQKS